MVKLMKKHFGLLTGSILGQERKLAEHPIKSSANYYEERGSGCAGAASASPVLAVFGVSHFSPYKAGTG